MRFSIAYNDDGTVLTSAGSEDAEQPQLVRSTLADTALPRLPPVLREQPSPLHRTETQLTEK